LMSPEALGAILGGVLIVFVLRSFWRNRRRKHRNEITPEAGGASSPADEAPSVPHKRGWWDSDPTGGNDGGGGDGGGGD
jgi:hypothetical protein